MPWGAMVGSVERFELGELGCWSAWLFIVVSRNVGLFMAVLVFVHDMSIHWFLLVCWWCYSVVSSAMFMVYVLVWFMYE